MTVVFKQSNGETVGRHKDIPKKKKDPAKKDHPKDPAITKMPQKSNGETVGNQKNVPKENFSAKKICR